MIQYHKLAKGMVETSIYLNTILLGGLEHMLHISLEIISWLVRVYDFASEFVILHNE